VSGARAGASARHANAITVDVEEWFHICGVGGALAPARWDSLPSRVGPTTRLLLEDLDRAGVRATFFVLGWVAERHPDLVAEIRRAGHEIGSHGFSHTRVYELTPASFADELRRSRRAVDALGALPPVAFRAPEWSISSRTPWALETLAREGFRVDASMAPLRVVGDVNGPREPHVHHTAGGDVLELPPLVADRFGQAMPLGWGWGLRMSSSRRVLRTIDRSNGRGLPAILTVHPWELDPDPPRVALPAGLRFAHYFRLGGFRARLMEILRGADLGPVAALPAVQAFR
jgi:polysaccharide deacetylase family protein (PEP-CTERM system associated)